MQNYVPNPLEALIRNFDVLELENSLLTLSIPDSRSKPAKAPSGKKTSQLPTPLSILTDPAVGVDGSCGIHAVLLAAQLKDMSPITFKEQLYNLAVPARYNALMAAIRADPGPPVGELGSEQVFDVAKALGVEVRIQTPKLKSDGTAVTDSWGDDGFNLVRRTTGASDSSIRVILTRGHYILAVPKPTS